MIKLVMHVLLEHADRCDGAGAVSERNFSLDALVGHQAYDDPIPKSNGQS